MLLTQSQVSRFWREFSAVVRLHDWDKAKAEAERKALLARAGFSSLTLVDRTKGYDSVLKELAALQDNLNGILSAEDSPRRVLIHTCRKLADEAYIVALAASSRFNCQDWLTMPIETLEQLRFTLADRAVQEHRQSTQTHRQSTQTHRKEPSSRLGSPDFGFWPTSIARSRSRP